MLVQSSQTGDVHAVYPETIGFLEFDALKTLYAKLYLQIQRKYFKSQYLKLGLLFNDPQFKKFNTYIAGDFKNIQSHAHRHSDSG